MTLALTLEKQSDSQHFPYSMKPFGKDKSKQRRCSMKGVLKGVLKVFTKNRDFDTSVFL